MEKKSFIVLISVLMILSFVGLSFSQSGSERLNPIMDGPNSPSGVATSSSQAGDSSAAWHAFDGKHSDVMNDVWNSYGADADPWLKYDFGDGNAVVVGKYAITEGGGSFHSSQMKDWELRASNDDSNWVVLDAQSDQTDWPPNERKEFIIDNNTAYRYYMIRVLAHNRSPSIDNVIIGELEFYAPEPNSVSPDTPLNLAVVNVNDEAKLTWQQDAHATSYNIMRSNDANGPFTLIGTSTDPLYIDSTVDYNTDYYYTVSATNDNGTSDQTAPVAFRIDHSSSESNYLIRITMNNSEVKEYTFSQSELNDFINWYENNNASTSKNHFVIQLKNNGPYKTRKDYLPFHSILFFEINEFM